MTNSIQLHSDLSLLKRHTADPACIAAINRIQDEIEIASQLEQMKIIQMQHKENTIRNLGKALMSYIESNAIG